MSDHVIYLAGGCFWGTEAYLKKLPGVLFTEVGYANSVVKNPDYDQVCSGQTGAAEAVKVRFDSTVIPLPLLLEAYYRTINPLSLNRQGNDVGSQYRTGIYWCDPADADVVKQSLRDLQCRYQRRLAIEASPLSNFYSAENYHQDYLTKNPRGYCHVNLADADAFVREHAMDFEIAAHRYHKPSLS